jgi:hypothetical protein
MFGLGRTPQIWIPTQFCSSLNFPLLGSSENALWMNSIIPKNQGRVFAGNSLIFQGVSAIATLIAGPLAEVIFEPLITSQKKLPFLSSLLGSGPGTGISLLYVLTSLCLVLVGILGFRTSQLWLNEIPTPDCHKSR